MHLTCLEVRQARRIWKTNRVLTSAVRLTPPTTRLDASRYREAAGAVGTRYSPRCAPRERECVCRHCEERRRRSNRFSFCGSMDCVAALGSPGHVDLQCRRRREDIDGWAG